MSTIDPNKELDEFFEDESKSKGKNLRLMLEELPISNFTLDSLKLTGIEPVFFKRNVFVIDTTIKESRNKLF